MHVKKGESSKSISQNKQKDQPKGRQIVARKKTERKLLDPSKIKGGEFLFGFRGFVNDVLCTSGNMIIFKNVQPIQASLLFKIILKKGFHFAISENFVVCSKEAFKSSGSLLSEHVKDILEDELAQKTFCSLFEGTARTMGQIRSTFPLSREKAQKLKGCRFFDVAGVIVVQDELLEVGSIKGVEEYDCMDLKLMIVTFRMDSFASFKIQAQQKLHDFKESERKSITIDPNLQSEERAYLHRLCKKLKLKSKSDGQNGINRVMTVWKNEDETNNSKEELESKEKKWQILRGNEKEDNLIVIEKKIELETIQSNDLKNEIQSSGIFLRESDNEVWICSVCETENDLKESSCIVCSVPREE